MPLGVITSVTVRARGASGNGCWAWSPVANRKVVSGAGRRLRPTTTECQGAAGRTAGHSDGVADNGGLHIQSCQLVADLGEHDDNRGTELHVGREKPGAEQDLHVIGTAGMDSRETMASRSLR
jgi:hypothetical protein